MNAQEYTDEQLVELHKSGNAEAFAEICERYKELVKGISRAYFLVGGDRDDLLQEGLLGLLKAVNFYNPGGGASFKTFAHLCIESNVKSAVKKAYNKGNVPLNNSVSLSEGFGVFAPDNPEDKVLSDEREREFMARLSRGLSANEKNILDLYLKGLSYAEIANEINGDVKKVDNALQRIRKKIIKKESGEK